MTQPTDVAATRPRPVDVAYALILTAAAAVLVFAALLPFQIGTAVDRQQRAAAAQGISRDSLEQQFVQVVIAECIIAALYVGMLVWTAFRIRAGRRRFRVVLIVLTVLGLVPLSAQALLVAVLLIVADVLVLLKPVSSWMREAEAARAAARARRRI